MSPACAAVTKTTALLQTPFRQPLFFPASYKSSARISSAPSPLTRRTSSRAFTPHNSSCLSRFRASSNFLQEDTIRRISGTLAWHGTVAIQNSRRDEEGKEMSISITPRASQRLREIMAREHDPELKLRINVTSGGCHGFQYLMSLTRDEVSKEDDTVFEADDGTGAKVVMDESSLELLKGSKVDYTMELIGSQFRIVDNPMATSSCGCGTSFDLKG
ncbi:MAG: hypothetical protein M1816_007020 [Peltula sp. TS41687]|nr:MAG: hypothetical protein M1816_007020 [Peltula sp. TS41687]